MTFEEAQEVIRQYFAKFSKLRSWLNTTQEFIKENGYCYSFFGRKRRLPNVFSSDKGVAAHEVRSGVNSLIQSVCSDVNLLGAIDTHNELKRKNMGSQIFALVHDSVVALVPDAEVEQYKEILARNMQKDRGCSIPGFPIGIDQEVGEDYSFGKFDLKYSIQDGVLVKNAPN